MTLPGKQPHARRIGGLLGFLILCLAVSALGGAVTATSVDSWYQTLRKPPFNPPDWLFAPVWSTLFVLMAVAAWRVWRIEGLRSRAMGAFAVQLFLNLLWSVLFFGLRAPDLALVEILVLLSSIAWTALLFARIDNWAGLLFLPYLAWVAFAAALNLAISYLN
jgi:benzodiazapine receptor